MINTLATDEEFLKRVSDDFIVVKWKVHKINLIDFGPIEKDINLNNINALAQNKALEEIIAQQHQIAGKKQEL